jgi:hypothetical protein
MITKYNQFINESVRDKMLPKSPEFIKSTLEGKPYLYIINKINKYKIDINDIFTKEEQDKMKTNDFCYFDEEKEVVLIDIEQLKKIVSGVGEGIRDYIVKSKQFYPLEYQNEIIVEFWENAWGDISIEEWNRLDKIMKELKGKNGVSDYEIIPGSLKLIITFDGKYQIDEI